MAESHHAAHRDGGPGNYCGEPFERRGRSSLRSRLSIQVADKPFQKQQRRPLQVAGSYARVRSTNSSPAPSNVTLSARHRHPAPTLAHLLGTRDVQLTLSADPGVGGLRPPPLGRPVGSPYRLLD